MGYTMRKLETSDIFKMSKILKKLDVKTNEIKLSKETTQTQVGIAIIHKALENLHLAEDEVNEFLSSLVGLSAEEFSKLPIEDTFEILTLFKEQKGIVNFLKLAGK